MLSRNDRSVLRSALARHIFCQCGVLLQISNSVLVGRNSDGAVVCGKCFDSAVSDFTGDLKDYLIIDGRTPGKKPSVDPFVTVCHCENCRQERRARAFPK